VVAFAYPLIMEGSTSECDAMEKKFIAVVQGELSAPGGVDDAMSVLLQSSTSKGRLMEIFVRQKYPNLPPVAACTLGYWRTLIDPGWLRPDARS
jgi:hypothetical protein